MYKFASGLAALALFVGGPAQAQVVTPDAAVAETTRSEQDRALDESRMPAQVLAFADYQPGDVVADFMAGNGYYTRLIASIVGRDGGVYAINPVGFHNAENWAPLLSAFPQIRTMPVEPRSMLLAPASVDSIFTHLVFHDIYWESEQYSFPRLDEDAVLANWYAALKPGGSVIVVDHVGPDGDPREVTERLHRVAPETVIAAMERAGFRLAEQSDMLRRSNDDLAKNVFDPEVRGKTDRFVMKFVK